MIYPHSMCTYQKIADELSLTSYHYELPAHLIADRPTPRRDQCKLLVYRCQERTLTHTSFDRLADYLPTESTLVFNQSKVFAARILGQRPSGGRAEFLFTSLHPKASEAHGNLYPAYIRTNRRKQIGDRFLLTPLQIEVEIRQILAEGMEFLVHYPRSAALGLAELLERYGSVPIPPYIRHGQGDEQDRLDYQTVYASSAALGSVAAPTAGLHFTPELITQLRSGGHRDCYLSLHVGPGTFAPVKSECILDHQMHEEFYTIDDLNLACIKSNPDKLIAVGTTALRSLESAYPFAQWQADRLDGTRIFLYPGKAIHSVRGLLTNFHLPQSTLLMLVATLTGLEEMHRIYQTAIQQNYRFYSYGDAMLILR